MASSEWDLLFWQKAGDLLRQAERIQRNFLQVAVGAQYRAAHGRSRAWEPPVNVIDAEESVWVIVAVPGVAADRVEVHLDGGQLMISGERPSAAVALGNRGFLFSMPNNGCGCLLRCGASRGSASWGTATEGNL
jgi:HSP20 family molecular chaperone IbpA